MAKALKITEEFFINMDNLLSIEFRKDSIVLTSVLPEEPIYIVGEKSGSTFGHFVLPVQEMKRLEREMREYLQM